MVDYKIIKDTPLKAIPQLIKKGIELGDASDAAEIRINNYDEETNTSISLPGTIAVQLNDKIVLYNLKTGPVEEFVKSLNPQQLNKQSAINIDPYQFNFIKNKCNSYTINERLVKNLRSNPFSHKQERLKILNYLLQNDSLATTYIQMVKGENKNSDLNSILGFNPGFKYEGLRFLLFTPVGTLGSSMYLPKLNNQSNVLGVNKAKPIGSSLENRI